MYAYRITFQNYDPWRRHSLTSYKKKFKVPTTHRVKCCPLPQFRLDPDTGKTYTLEQYLKLEKIYRDSCMDQVYASGLQDLIIAEHYIVGHRPPNKEEIDRTARARETRRRNKEKLIMKNKEKNLKTVEEIARLYPEEVRLVAKRIR